MKRGAAVVCMALGALALGAADFLTSEELRARLDELYPCLPDGSRIVTGYSHVDRCYNTNGPFTPYEYRCPTCGNATWYRDKILIGDGIDIAKYLTWARTSVEKLQALRLNVRLDERTLCATCRSALKIPDGGVIVQIPKVRSRDDERPESFPFALGERVNITCELRKNVFGVTLPNPEYWVQAKELAEAIARESDRVMDVRMGPSEACAKVMMKVTRWAFGCKMPASETNGWVRYRPPRSILSAPCFEVPKGALGELTYAGAMTSRTDMFTPLWTINGKRVQVWQDDVRLLKKFLTCEHPQNEFDLRVKAQRLEQLLNPKTPGDGKTLADDASCEVEIEVDL